METIENFENEFPGIDVNYVFQKCIEDQEDMKYGILTVLPIISRDPEKARPRTQTD